MDRAIRTLALSISLATACGHDAGVATPASPASELAPQTPSQPAAELPDIGGDEVVRRLVELGVTDNHVHEHLRVLTETIGPRLTSSHNLLAAEAWCRDQLSSWGLKAELEQWGEFAVGFDRGPWHGGMVAPDAVEYEFTTPAWSAGALGPVRGPAMLLPTTLRQVRAQRDRLAGAWIVQSKSQARKTNPRLLAALRRVGVAGFVRPARSDEGLVHTGGRPPASWDELPSEVEIVVRADQHADLVGRLARDEAVELAFSVDNRFFRGPVPLHNVVADLVGSTRPDQYVIVGGHLDSWDGATGANDNGTGVATTLEAARLLRQSGARPARTIRFILWSGEEQGLLGSKAYVAAHPELVESTSAVLVHDGGTNYLSGLRVTPPMFADISDALGPLTRLDPDKPFKVSLADSLLPGGSDHTPFIQAGVPGFFWEQAGEADYSFVHHTQHDRIDAAREDYQKHSAMVVAIAAYRLANLDGLLDRSDSAPLSSRRLGVEFDGTRVRAVVPGGMAARAGWKSNDRVMSVDGAPVANTRAIVRAVRAGAPVKAIVLERGGSSVATELDYRADEAELERKRRRESWRAAGLPVPGESTSATGGGSTAATHSR